MFVQTFEQVVHKEGGWTSVTKSNAEPNKLLVNWSATLVTQPHTHSLIMGYGSYYTYGLPTFLIIVIALYLLFTGMFYYRVYKGTTH